jgi:hypothetical protein
MPTYLDILPEDIQTIIYKYLYSSILRDMKDESIYKNTKHFHKLLEITADPLICDLDYLGMLNINSIYDIFKYKKDRIEYDELFQTETSIYQRSHFTKNLMITLDNIVISNDVLSNLYKSNKRYYKYFVKEYINFDILNEVDICDYNNITRKINKANFMLQQNEPFACLAELLYNVIDFYNNIQNIINIHIYFLECLEDDGHVLTQRQRKDKHILDDMFIYHINNRFIIRFDYDIDNKSVFPILLSY